MHIMFLLMDSYIEERKIEIEKMLKKRTGKNEPLPKSYLIDIIKRSEGGCFKIQFDSKVKLYHEIIDFSILFDINLDDFDEAIMAFASYKEMGIKGNRFVGIYYENNDFVIKMEIEPINEKESDAEPEKLILQDSAI
ncbi:MAG: hypothetical protein ACKOZZ_16280 [Bacteroidota bacterium]